MMDLAMQLTRSYDYHCNSNLEQAATVDCWGRFTSLASGTFVLPAPDTPCGTWPCFRGRGAGFGDGAFPLRGGKPEEGSPGSG